MPLVEKRNITIYIYIYSKYKGRFVWYTLHTCEVNILSVITIWLLEARAWVSIVWEPLPGVSSEQSTVQHPQGRPHFELACWRSFLMHRWPQLFRSHDNKQVNTPPGEEVSRFRDGFREEWKVEAISFEVKLVWSLHRWAIVILFDLVTETGIKLRSLSLSKKQQPHRSVQTATS